MTDHKTTVFAATDAKQLLANPAWVAAWKAMHAHLEARELSCNTATDKESATDIIRCKQLLRGLQREVTRIIENGEVAEILMDELDKKKEQSKLRGIFRR
jgi:hypothetical protein